MRRLSWLEVYTLALTAPPGKLYGVPRGGQIVAGLTGRAVDTPEEADAIVDDIIDSGATHDAWVKKTGKPFWALVDRTVSPSLAGWIVFPWEESPEQDVQENVTRLLQFIGENPKRDGLLDTPKRVVKALREMTVGYGQDPKEILKVDFDAAGYDEMVVLRSVDFFSLCEHHILPFHGTVSLAYIPQTRVVGLSKLARLVEVFARRLQVQEKLTKQIGDALQEHLSPRGWGVVIRAQHLCMAARGVGKQRSEMVTSALGGFMRDDQRSREEFLHLAGV